jgi:16S rRNA (adenine(1408)-N(1))-methyltransferase
VALIVGSVETVACDLAGIAHEVRVHFPWGSLLRDVIGEDDAVLAALAGLPRPGGTVTAMLSVTTRDGVAAGRVDPLRLASRWMANGLTVRALRALTRGDVEEARSSWGKRLGAGCSREGLYVRAERSLR